MNKETEFKRSVAGQDVYCESSSEYVLPDYNSDVRKILFSEARARPAGKFVGSDEVEFTGLVVYNVIYSDSDGKIGGTSFSSDYDFTVKISSENIENVICDTRIANSAIRLVGPRKLSAKCSLVSGIHFTERVKYLPEGSAFDTDGGAEVLKRSLDIRSKHSSESREREYAEELCRLDGAIEDEVKVIYCKAEIIPETVTAEGGEACIRGELVMRAIIENGDQPAYLAEKSVKIEQTLPIEEADGEMVLKPDIIITSEKASVRADEDGCDVIMDVIAEISVVGDFNQTVEVISDAFSTEYTVENDYCDLDYSELIGNVTSDERYSAKIARSDATEGVIREILFVNAEPRVDTVEPGGNSVLLKGEIKYSGIASEVNDDGTVSYSSLKISTPFEQTVNISCQNATKPRFEIKCSSDKAEASVDANMIYLSANIKASVLLSRGKSERVLTHCSANTEERFEKRGSVVTVYYPDSDETLFSVAKKFHIGLSKLCENNSTALGVSIDDINSVPVIKKLLIY